MEFICPTCGKNLPRELKIIVPHTEEHVINVIKEKHPSWKEADGVCRKCYELLKEQLHGH